MIMCMLWVAERTSLVAHLNGGCIAVLWATNRMSCKGSCKTARKYHDVEGSFISRVSSGRGVF